MRLSSVLLSSLCTLASAQCGTVANQPIKALHASYAADPLLGRRHEPGQTLEIPTYFHVITANNTLAGGHIPHAAIDRQVAVLNKAYAEAGFSFILNATADYVLAPGWQHVEVSSETELTMKSALRRGDYATLNVYVASLTAPPELGNVLGIATFPEKPTSKRTLTLDGVIVHPVVLPGLAANPFNQGVTLVHEVGHWLSLLHTFDPPDDAADDDELAGCRGPGDYIFDTPAEGTAAYGCLVGRDTCTGSLEAENPTSMPGPDPVHNYMDYSDDACLYTFTPGQVERMMTAFSDERVNYVEGEDEPEPEQGPAPNANGTVPCGNSTVPGSNSTVIPPRNLTRVPHGN
ncbi:metalloprotease MEP1-like protein [Cordyceps militaris CM01]|uniref:Metalloprotease MEP1-like protein n=1 Tax=Cordyceps militaris (strain CM01) TaxID=983644 RepID=G3J3E2_CORMM|nr:metalloprotease MEP1-like protein [Cordyceps militaris CM01]EGX95672.1 metalloprotease MEP1-like protein [Cordyceps militaris CM01]